MASFPWIVFLCGILGICAEPADIQDVVDVAIIGAGYSGLSAAHELQKAGLSFRVLEARDRVGGRTLNRNVGDSNASDNAIELGGEWLAPQHVHARNLFEKLGFSQFRRPYNFQNGTDPDNGGAPLCSGDCAIRVRTDKRGWRQAATQSEVLGLLAPETQEAIQRVKSVLFNVSAEVPCSAPLSHPNASYYDSMSWDAYLRVVHGLSGEAYWWLSGYADDAESLRQVSALAVFWTQNCTNGVVGSPKEDLYRIRGGTQGPAEVLAAQMKERIQLEARVSDIHAVSSGQHVVSSTKGTVTARHVLIAGVPPPVLLGIHFQPPLPSEVAQFLQRFPLGTSLKYMLVYKTPWWRAAGYLGKILLFNTSLYTTECLDNSPYSWSRGVLMCFVEGAQNRAFIQLPAEQRKSTMLSVVKEAFGEEHQDEVEEVVEHNWADDEFSRGAYSTFPMVGVLSNFWQVFSRIYSSRQLGAPGIWIAGADYSSGGLGYIDGAISSGAQAANLIIDQLRGLVV